MKWDIVSSGGVRARVVWQMIHLQIKLRKEGKWDKESVMCFLQICSQKAYISEDNQCDWLENNFSSIDNPLSWFLKLSGEEDKKH